MPDRNPTVLNCKLDGNIFLFLLENCKFALEELKCRQQETNIYFN
jgi:hypothetical protein